MNTLIVKAEKYVIHLINENLNKSFVYHNILHTKKVVEKIQELIKDSNIITSDKISLLLAAWFHDVGYTISINEHEVLSAEIATKFLIKNKFSNIIVGKVSSLILSTKMGNEPENELEKIINDADCAHVGSKNFSDLTELLRKEWELTQQKVFTEEVWLQENISFLTKGHRFYSDYAYPNWEKQKSKNLTQLLKSQKKIQQESFKLKQKK